MINNNQCGEDIYLHQYSKFQSMGDKTYIINSADNIEKLVGIKLKTLFLY